MRTEAQLPQQDIPLVISQFARKELDLLIESPVFSGIDVPHGDGTHVVIIPGFSESDNELKYVFIYLDKLGYIPESAGIGTNFGYPWQKMQIAKKTAQIEERFGKIHIVGHSLGGFFASQIACEDPDVEKVVTLGSPYLNHLNTTQLHGSIHSIHSPLDGVVPAQTSQLKGPHTRNIEVRSPNHFELLCHRETYVQLAEALSS